MGLLVVAGAFLPCFSMEILGLAGIVIDLGSSEAKQTYSLVGSGLSIALQGTPQKYGGVAGPFAIGSLYIFVAFVAPLLQLATLALLWAWPLTLRAQKTLFVWLEMISAWSGMQVFILGVLVALVEMPQVSSMFHWNINILCIHAPAV